MRNKTKNKSRSPNDFHLGVLADKLACHTIQICKNPKVFDPTYNDYLIRDIIKYAKDAAIYILCANDIRASGDQDRELRYKLQSKALWDYKCLRAHINMAARAYHLRASKTEYWMSLTLEAENMLKAWMRSDSKNHNT